jgi:hypothetical protein
MKAVFNLLIFFALMSITFNVGAQSKRTKTQATATKRILCKTNDVSFQCPKGYKVVLDGNDSSGIFLAKNTEFKYSVFAIARKNEFELDDLMTRTVETLLKTLYPKESPTYRWKTVEFANDKPSSKFEVTKKALLGFNGNQLVTIEYRHILMNGKNLITGTVVRGWNVGEQAEAEFEQGLNTANSGCFDAVRIIHKLTGEKISEEDGPCLIEAEATLEN